MTIRIPTYRPPSTKIKLGEIELIPGPRINYQQYGSGSHVDSLDVEIDKDGPLMREWLIFHCFINNSSTPIDYYLHEKYGHTLKFVRDKSMFMQDYSNFLPIIYWRKEAEARKLPKQSYTDLYNLYNKLDPIKKDLITAYLLALTSHDDKPGRKIFDRTYWRIAQYFSIVDSIIGQPTFCSEQLKCDKCKSSDMPHHSVSATKHVKDTLALMIVDVALTKHYQDIILTARNEIRHSTVHAAKLPNIITPPFTKDFEQRHYGTKESIEQHKEDAYALQALEGKLEEATWHLLMNHIYNHGIFEPTRGVSVAHISVQTNKISKKKTEV